MRGGNWRDKKMAILDYSIMLYFKNIMDFDNENNKYREETEKEFKSELEKSIGQKIKWKNKKT